MSRSQESLVNLEFLLKKVPLHLSFGCNLEQKAIRGKRSFELEITF